MLFSTAGKSNAALSQVTTLRRTGGAINQSGMGPITKPWIQKARDLRPSRDLPSLGAPRSKAANWAMREAPAALICPLPLMSPTQQ